MASHWNDEQELLDLLREITSAVRPVLTHMRLRMPDPRKAELAFLAETVRIITARHDWSLEQLLDFMCDVYDASHPADGE
jgi:hypothetical protein